MLNPPLIRGDIEITDVIPQQRVFFVIIHVKADPYEMGTVHVQSHIANRTRIATKYLVDEGYIVDPLSPWTAMVSSVCHPV
jgi:hypothetical protein